MEKHGLEFPVLHDAGNVVAGKFGLVWALPDDLREVYRGFGADLPDFNGEAGWTLPMPARYLVDRTGLIRYARVHPDYTDRPEPQETLEALQELAARG